ncbi:MAG: ATP-binding cassette domain-containing protein, partial [Acidobacteria bacterium]|nr:ATP-binding cassette domain-containing protein [Acidobacteriota bacterium]
EFSVERGEIFGFLGPNGAGKSTTQKILIRLLSGYEGEVEVFGRNLALWNNDYYEQVGVSFELPNHYLKLSAVENLTYFGSLYAGETREPQELLGLVGLAGVGGRGLDGLGENADFLDVLKSEDVQTLHTLEATLEDVFIKVTGRELE